MLSGWDVLVLLKGDAITQNIRVVIMKRPDEPKISTHQADGILLKPIKVNELSAFLPDCAAAPTPLKFLYLNQNLEDAVIELFQDLGHSVLEAEDLHQCDVLSKIWHPDLFLLNGDNQFLLKYLKDISQLNLLVDLPILIITKSAIAEINWLRDQFPSLNLHDCLGLDLDNLDTARARILLSLHQSITKAMCYVLPETFATT
jgi:hypothetical protein